MSYITFNYRCTECDTEESRLVERELMDQQWCCGKSMIRLPANPRTTFRFADSKLKD